MLKSLQATACCACVFFAGSAFAQDDFEPESISVESTIKPGPNIFVSAAAWGGAGAIYIFSADDLSYKGDVSTGLTSQFTLSADGQTIYASSIFPKRITYGPIEAVLQSYDVQTLVQKSETIIPSHVAQTMTGKYLLQLTADGRFAIAQNATPATSVTVIDLEAGAVASEVPLPGCWAIYVAPEGAKFSALCGDGTFVTVALDDSGQVASQTDSEALFDIDADPVFVHAERVGGDLLFMSFAGTIYRVSDAGDAMTLVDSFSIIGDDAAGWAPGGYQLMSYNEPHGVLFVAMHGEADDGSHKDGSQEIWAVNVESKGVLSRSAAEHITNLSVTDDETPVIFGVNSHEGGLYRLAVDPAANFAATQTHHLEETGEISLVLTEP